MQYDLRVRVTTDSTTDPAGTLLNYLDSYGYRSVNGVGIDSIELIGEVSEPEPSAGGDGATLNDLHAILTEIRDLLSRRL